MRKIILVSIAIAILTIGAAISVYAADTDSPRGFGCGSQLMYQNDDTYKAMIDIMRENGFEAAKAMENRDYAAMNDFMNSLTGEQYNQMIEMMKNNGYSGMANIMSSIGRDGMLDMHNSMMGRYSRK